MSSGEGLFAAQNMMYRHTITIYDKNGNRKAKILDEVNLTDYGFSEYANESYLGGPVEAAFTKDGEYLWVSNYSMVGEGFEHPGCDACNGNEFDPGFLYKINTESYEIENVVKVGAVPKFLAISADQKKLLVSNWSSGDISIVDLEKEKEVQRVKVGSHPRGIDITADSKTAFVTVMGSTKIAEIDLETYEVDYIKDVGRSPRSLILGHHDSVMYVSLNSAASVLKYNRFTNERTSCRTSSGPRSMCISPEGDFLYVVNYFDNSFSKINSDKMEVVEKVKTSAKPIGICGNWDDSEIWVACYSGRIEIFKDFNLDSLHHGGGILGFDLSSFWDFSKAPSKSEDEEMKDPITEPVLIDSNPNENEILEEIIIVDLASEPKERLLPIEKGRFALPIQSKGECQYHVIAGSFSVLENAHKRRDELAGKGYSATIISGALNYVSANCFEKRASAEESASQLKSQLGYSAWILKR